MSSRWIACFIVVIVLMGCGSHDREPGHSAEQVIEQDLLVALLRVKNLHHRARVLSAEGNLGAAISAIREILTVRFPANAPETDDVRNDARARLAKLLLARGEIEDAMIVVREGIGQSTRDSFFVANLYTVEGEIHEARASVLDASNDVTEKQRAVDERKQALECYDKSNHIDVVIEREAIQTDPRDAPITSTVLIVLATLLVGGIVVAAVLVRTRTKRKRRR